MKKQTKKQIKFVPAVLVRGGCGEDIEYIIPKKLSKKFFEEKHILVEILNDFYGYKTDEELQTLRNRWDLESKLFNGRWDKYKKNKRTTLYIKEQCNSIMFNLKWDSTYSGTKWVTRAFMMSETQAAHIVKWGGSYDIAYTDGTLIPTGIRCVSDLTLNDWVELANKLKTIKIK